MTPVETAAIFAGIPAAIFGLIVAIVYGSSSRRAPRYRPGRPFTFAPVWFLSDDRTVVAARGAGDTHAAVETRHALAELTAPRSADPYLAAGSRKGGARGTW